MNKNTAPTRSAANQSTSSQTKTKSTSSKKIISDESSEEDIGYKGVDPVLDLNDNLTAKPDQHSSPGELRTDSPNDDVSPYGEMNERDAILSGYTDKNGHAVSMAKQDTKGSPTGSFTDIGAGRSSVVKKKSEMEAKKTPAQIHSLDVTSDDRKTEESSVNYPESKVGYSDSESFGETIH